MISDLGPGELLSEEDLHAHLKGCGTHPRVFRGCRIVQPEQVRIGDYVQIDEQVFVLGGDGVEIGKHVHLAFQCSISGGGQCRIGDFAGLSAGVRLVTGTDVADGSGLTNPTVPTELRAVVRGKVDIGAHVLIYTNSVVLPNVIIGEGAVVAAGSMVHHDLKPWGIYGGNPLVQVGVRPSDKILEMARQLR